MRIGCICVGMAYLAAFAVLAIGGGRLERRVHVSLLGIIGVIYLFMGLGPISLD